MRTTKVKPFFLSNPAAEVKQQPNRKRYINCQALTMKPRLKVLKLKLKARRSKS